MKLYSKKYHRNVERQVHFGVGKGTHTACGQVLFSRFVLASVWGDTDPSLITSDITKVSCKRCLKTRETRLRKLILIESSCPGIFDRPTLCSEEWLLAHALDVGRSVIENQTLELAVGNRNLTVRVDMKPKDRTFLIKELVKEDGIPDSLTGGDL